MKTIKTIVYLTIALLTSNNLFSADGTAGVSSNGMGIAGTTSTPGVGLNSQMELGQTSSQIGNQPTYQQGALPAQASPSSLVGGQNLTPVSPAQQGLTSANTTASKETGTNLPIASTYPPTSAERTGNVSNESTNMQNSPQSAITSGETTQSQQSQSAISSGVSQ